MKQKLLLVEDEDGLRMTLCDRLESENYSIDTASTGTIGLEKARNGKYDLILLDIMLPELDGFEICKTLRKEGSVTPILMLTAKCLLEDKIAGLTYGADDYLTKPFEVSELLARINALIRRSSISYEEMQSSKTSPATDVVLDLSHGMLYNGKKEYHLLSQEVKLLEYFISRKGMVVSREELLASVWGYGLDVSTRTVDVHVARLRRKFGDVGVVPKYIQTVRGTGYFFNCPKMI